MKSFKGTALVTGGAKRIGEGLAFKLAEMGFKIALHCNSSLTAAQDVAKRIQEKKGVCEIFPCDLNDEYAVQTLISTVRKQFPGLNLLMNNASVFEKSDIKTYDLENLKRNFTINLFTPYILTAEFARHCKKGHIINILDTHITKNRTAHFDYLLSKKTLAELTNMSAVALAPDIRVNAIAPGLILPPAGKNVPLMRKGNVEDITRAMEFLIKNNYLTGQIIFCDGGEHLG